jgi:hypothetical protein
MVRRSLRQELPEEVYVVGIPQIEDLQSEDR